MSDPTIQLQKDLEAWYDLSPRYFDNQRNHIQDRSGNGRHAEASGGPTVGVEGPASFDAASFDGTDDYFTVASDLATTGEQSAFVLAKSDVVSDGTFRHVWCNEVLSGNQGFTLYSDDSASQFFVEANGVVKEANSFSADEWFLAGFTWDGSAVTYYFDGIIGTDSMTTWTAGTNSAQIGADSSNGHLWDGDVAFAGRWFRSLTAAEVQFLQNMTAPMRANV